MAVWLLGFAVVATVLGTGRVKSQPASPSLAPGDHRMEFVSTADGTTQPYRLFVPRAVRSGRALPLLVVLHGKGATHDTWFDFTPVKEVAELRGTVVASPYARGDWFYRGPAEQDVLDVLEAVQRALSIHPDRVHLMGHSMGGWGTWWIGLRHPCRFATIMPMAGMAPMELLPNARHLEPFVLHSTDDPVVGIENARDPARRLIDLGLSLRYREEDGYGHRSKMISDNFHALFEWMERHRVERCPRRVTFATRTPKAGTAYWMRIVATENFPALATLDAGIDTSGTLHVQTDNVKAFALHLCSLPQHPENPLPVVADGQALPPIQREQDWALFRRGGEGRESEGWRYEIVEAQADLPRYESPVLARAAAVPEGIERQAFVTRALGERLRRETNAEGCLVTEAMFRLPESETVTADDILDCYIWADQELVAMRLTRETLRATLDGLDETQRFLWGTPHWIENETRKDQEETDAGEEVAVVMPRRLAARFEAPAVPVAGIVAEHLLRSVAEGERFP